MRASLTTCAALALWVLAGCEADGELGGADGGPPDALPDSADVGPPDATPDSAPACEDGAVEPCEIIAGCGGERVCTAGAFGDCRPPDERCDGVDNDCDGQTDEEVDAGQPCETGEAGACAAGTTACEGGATRCVPDVEPSAEQCDGLDNDCDGALDEAEGGAPFARDCYDGPPETLGVGPCVGGIQTCQGGVFGACVGQVVPAVEICDGVDNSCSGEIDDVGGAGCACRPGETRDCYTGPDGTAGVGPCRTGSQSCLDDGSSFGPCEGEVVPAVELCATRDQDLDCDGDTDDADGTGDVCAVGVGACRVEGVTVCGADDAIACSAVAGEAEAEVCDGVDNDCDGDVDDVEGLGDACTAGIGACVADGVRVCDLDAGALVCDAPVGEPAAEVCDGVDNDCDGVVDDVDGVGADCVVDEGGCPADGVRVCDIDRGALTCAALPELICDDGLDDDCNGLVDCDDEACGAEIACTCGDGVLDGAEACDDGNVIDGDGCSARCGVEGGWGCRAPTIERCAPGVDAQTVLLTPGVSLPAAGGEWGDQFADVCPLGEVVVGFDFATGPAPGLPDGEYVTKSRARCARLTIGDDVELTPTRLLRTRGTSNALNHELHCPEQHVVVGYQGWAEPGYWAQPALSGVQILCAPAALDDGAVVLGPAVPTEAVGRRDTLVGRFECAVGEFVRVVSGRADEIIGRFTLRCDPVVDGCRVPSRCGLPADCFYDFDEPPLPAVFPAFGVVGWSIDPAGGSEGRGGAAVSGAIARDQASAMRLVDVPFPNGGRISFRHRISSRDFRDTFRFFDGREVLETSGEQPWAEFEHAVTPGRHTFEFVYRKTSLSGGGSDNARIDDLLVEGAAALCD